MADESSNRTFAAVIIDPGTQKLITQEGSLTIGDNTIEYYKKSTAVRMAFGLIGSMIEGRGKLLFSLQDEDISGYTVAKWTNIRKKHFALLWQELRMFLQLFPPTDELGKAMDFQKMLDAPRIALVKLHHLLGQKINYLYIGHNIMSSHLHRNPSGLRLFLIPRQLPGGVFIRRRIEHLFPGAELRRTTHIGIHISLGQCLEISL